jgi:hypothetical protein
MALSGTLTDFALDEVLRFIGSARKSGQLTVEQGARRGVVWLEEGKVAAAHLDEADEPAEVVFDLLRLDDGKFSFNADVDRPEGGSEVTELDAVLNQAHAMLDEWREVEKVVPSIKTLVALSATPPGGDIRIDTSQWATICAVGAGGPVASVADRLGMREFAACKAVKALVDAGLAAVAPSSDSRVKLA